MFVSLQVDGQGYMTRDAFANTVIDWYTEDSLKIFAKNKSKICTNVGNSKAKGTYKEQEF
jgi:hypothetical protein